MGAAACLVNTAIASSDDPVRMAGAFRAAVEAGRNAWLAGAGAVMFVFDKDGTFIMKKSEQGKTLGSGSYRMQLQLPIGEYRIATWAGMSDAFEMPPQEQSQYGY